jgi:NTP pyrophosphatase (non-canonical NTP hydrolase)
MSYQMASLKPDPILRDYQQYVSFMEQERGFHRQSPIDRCLLLGEEVGELFKAVREHEGLSIDETCATKNIGRELADIFTYLCSIANLFHIDLEQEFRNKEEQNGARAWHNK